MNLIVHYPFGDYQRGDRITDPEEIKRVLQGENKHHVGKIAAAPAKS